MTPGPSSRLACSVPIPATTRSPPGIRDTFSDSPAAITSVVRIPWIVTVTDCDQRRRAAAEGCGSVTPGCGAIVAPPAAGWAALPGPRPSR